MQWEMSKGDVKARRKWLDVTRDMVFSMFIGVLGWQEADTVLRSGCSAASVRARLPRACEGGWGVLATFLKLCGTF